MTAYEYTSPPGAISADFALRTDESTPNLLRPEGPVLYFQRRTDLSDGDVGLFHSREGMVLRQFCQDSAGNIYLFSLDRTRGSEDIVIPPGRETPVCYGRAILSRTIPLPMD